MNNMLKFWIAIMILFIGFLVSACTNTLPNSNSVNSTITVTETDRQTVYPPTIVKTVTVPPVTLTQTHTVTFTINPPEHTDELYEIVEPVWYELVRDDGGDMTFEWHTAVRNLSKDELRLYIRVDFLAATGSYAWDFAIVKLQPGQVREVTGSEMMIAEFGNQLNGIELKIEVL